MCKNFFLYGMHREGGGGGGGGAGGGGGIYYDSTECGLWESNEFNL